MHAIWCMAMVRVCGCRVGERHGGHQLDVRIGSRKQTQEHAGMNKLNRLGENDSENSICVLENVRSKPFEPHHKFETVRSSTGCSKPFETHQVRNQRAGASTNRFGIRFRDEQISGTHSGMNRFGIRSICVLDNVCSKPFETHQAQNQHIKSACRSKCDRCTRSGAWAWYEYVAVG